MFAHSYARRKRFEARLIAVEVAKMLTGATTPQNAGGSAGHTITRSGKPVDRVQPRAMLGMLGAKVDF